MARIEAEAWEREEECPEAEPHESRPPPHQGCAGAAGEPCTLRGSIAPRVGQAQATKEGRFWDEPVVMCDRLEADSGEMCGLRSCPRLRTHTGKLPK